MHDVNIVVLNSALFGIKSTNFCPSWLIWKLLYQIQNIASIGFVFLIKSSLQIDQKFIIGHEFLIGSGKFLANFQYWYLFFLHKIHHFLPTWCRVLLKYWKSIKESATEISDRLSALNFNACIFLQPSSFFIEINDLTLWLLESS